MSFARALRSFLGSIFWVIANPALRAWYLNLLKRSFLVALFILTLLGGGGAWGLHRLQPGRWGDVGALIWIVALLLVSGKVTVSVMAALVSNIGDEKALLSALTGIKIVSLKPAAWSDRRAELWATVRGFGIALFAWPLFLVPVLIPLGVLLFAWTMACECLAAANRICHQNGARTRQDEIRPTAAFAIGLGLLPALAALVPIVGWAVWPLLLIASMRVSLRAP